MVTENILVVALELLGPMVASRLALPRAVEKSIGLGKGVLVKGVVPGRRFTVTAGAARKGRRQNKCILTEDSSMGIIRDHANLTA